MEACFFLKKILMLVTIVTVLIGIAVYCLRGTPDEKPIELNKLVTAFWLNTNMEVVLFCEPVSEEDPNRGLIGVIGGDKDMHRGSEKSKIIDIFVDRVQAQYAKKVKVLFYKENSATYELIYEDGLTIVWNRVKRQSSIKDF
jgi:hypothetical protein